MKKVCFILLFVSFFIRLSGQSDFCIDSSLYAYKDIQDTVSIALILPLDLDLSIKNNKLSKSNFDKFTKHNYQLYQGVMIALDSIEAAYSDIPYIDMYIIDSKSKTEGLEKWNSDGFKGIDMIFSGLTKENDQIIESIKNTNIPLVSILSLNTADEVYPFYIQVQPTLSTHCKQIARKIESSYDKAKLNLIKVTSNSDVSKRAIGYAGYELDSSVFYIDDRFSSADLIKLLVPEKTNVIYAPLLSTTEADNFLKLAKNITDYQIEIYGMPTWSRLSAQNYKNSNNTIYFTSGFYKFSKSHGSRFVDLYKERYGEVPSSFAYKGYETSLYFISKYLSNGNPLFYNILNDESPKPINNFEFEPMCKKDNTLHWENQNVYFLKGEDGDLELE